MKGDISYSVDLYTKTIPRQLIYTKDFDTLKEAQFFARNRDLYEYTINRCEWKYKGVKDE